MEALPIEDQELLVRIVSKRIIEQRRNDLVTDLEESLEAYRRGEVRIGTMDDLMKDLEEDMGD